MNKALKKEMKKHLRNIQRIIGVERKEYKKEKKINKKNLNI